MASLCTLAKDVEAFEMIIGGASNESRLAAASRGTRYLVPLLVGVSCGLGAPLHRRNPLLKRGESGAMQRVRFFLEKSLLHLSQCVELVQWQRRDFSKGGPRDACRDHHLMKTLCAMRYWYTCLVASFVFDRYASDTCWSSHSTWGHGSRRDLRIIITASLL